MCRRGWSSLEYLHKESGDIEGPRFVKWNGVQILSIKKDTSSHRTWIEQLRNSRISCETKWCSNHRLTLLLLCRYSSLAYKTCILIIHISSCISGSATCIEDIYNVANRTRQLCHQSSGSCKTLWMSEIKLHCH